MRIIGAGARAVFILSAALPLSLPQIVHWDSVPSGANSSEIQAPSPNVERLSLGKERTLFLVLGSNCDSCWRSVDFYKELLALPGMDGKAKRFVVLASDGVWPVKRQLDAKGLKPHRLTSYPRIENTIELPDRPPGILVVDGAGMRLGMWTGPLSTTQKEEVLTAIRDK